MTMYKKKQPAAVWVIPILVFLFIINIRVEAGVGSAVERALDGIVGGVVLLSSVFFALRFFKYKEGESDKEKQYLTTK